MFVLWVSSWLCSFLCIKNMVFRLFVTKEAYDKVTLVIHILSNKPMRFKHVSILKTGVNNIMRSLSS